MSTFLATLESVQTEQAGVRDVFKSTANESDGQYVGSRKLRNTSPVYKRSLAEAAKLIAGVVGGREPIWKLQEVMTTSDFPILFGDILDRSVLAAYQEWPVGWTNIAKRSTLADFKNAKIYPPIWGADGPLDVVNEAAPYPAVPLHEQTPITWHLDKYGRIVPFSWEAMINDDLDQLTDMPTRLGRAARRTEDWAVTNLYVGPSGPDPLLYTVGYKNQIITANGAASNNPPLTIAGLQSAFTVLNSMFDENGQPILRDAVTLVVPPALEIVALNILNAIQINATASDAGGVQGNGTTVGHQELVVQNWMRNRLTLVVNPYIPMIATSNAATSWWLFASPNFSREAIRIGFLRGHETPEIWMKSPNAVRVGGGNVDPMSGDFDTDTIVYRVRHVMASTIIDGKSTVSSNGSGS